MGLYKLRVDRAKLNIETASPALAGEIKEVRYQGPEFGSYEEIDPIAVDAGTEVAFYAVFENTGTEACWMWTEIYITDPEGSEKEYTWGTTGKEDAVRLEPGETSPGGTKFTPDMPGDWKARIELHASKEKP